VEFEDYVRYDATGLARLVARGELSAFELLECTLNAIEELNPDLNAVICTDFDRARQFSESAASHDAMFFGVPYLVKDLNTNVAGLATTNGSRLLRDNVPVSDAVLIQRLRKTGLNILGKTNTPEFGLNVCTSPAHFGATRNPFDPTKSAGGSSGGSAAAVASGMVPAAHATDSGGSIRIPASNCGLFGLKPTRGLIPLGNDLPEGLGGMSTGHAVTHSVRDSQALLQATAGPLPGDPATGEPLAPKTLENLKGYGVALWTDGLTGESVSDQCVDAARDAAALCESLGAHVVEISLPIDGALLRECFDVLFTANIAAALHGFDDDSLEDGIEPATLACRNAAARYRASDYAAAIQSIQAATRRMNMLFQKYDVLLSPTLANPPRSLGDLSMRTPDWDRYLHRLLDEIPFTPLFNATGGPAMSVPLGRDDSRLPIGVQFATLAGGDLRLLSLAALLEQAAPWHSRQ